MNFSTTSYLAGVGSVVAALTVGFSGGFFLAAPPAYVEQNRLQRVTANAAPSNPAPQTAATANPAPQAVPSAKPEITEANAAAAPARVIEQPARPEPTQVMAKTAEPEAAPVIAKAPDTRLPDPARTVAVQERDAQTSANAERLRAAEARNERKQAEARRFAERRRQRDIERATIAVRRITRDSDPQQVADGFEAPRFGFFGESTDR